MDFKNSNVKCEVCAADKTMDDRAKAKVWPKKSEETTERETLSYHHGLTLSIPQSHLTLRALARQRYLWAGHFNFNHSNMMLQGPESRGR